MPWWRMFDTFKQAAVHAKMDGLYLMPRQARRAASWRRTVQNLMALLGKGNPYPWSTPAWFTR